MGIDAGQSRDRHDLFMGDLCRFVWVGYLWFFGWWNYPNFEGNLEFFLLWYFVWEKDIAHIGWNGYFWITEKVLLNSLSVLVHLVHLLSHIFSVKPSQAQELLFSFIVDTHLPRPAGKSLGWWSICIGCGIGGSGSPQLYRLGFGVVVWHIWHEILQPLWPTTVWSKRRKRMKKWEKIWTSWDDILFPLFSQFWIFTPKAHKINSAITYIHRSLLPIIIDPKI